jgi:myo-inositol-1(or 4)-monophosphatase
LTRAARLFGATGFDMSSIAAGKSEITVNYGSKIFDYAPGALLVREAGGIVVNSKGDPWTIDDNNLVAANKYLMPKVLEIIKGF